MANGNGKMYTRVYTSEEKRKTKKTGENGGIEKKKPDRIKNEIMGEFSRYGMTVRY